MYRTLYSLVETSTSIVNVNGSNSIVDIYLRNSLIKLRIAILMAVYVAQNDSRDP